MRYAVYFTPPPDHPLTERAAAWIGRDAFTGAPVAPPVIDTFEADEISALAAFPRRYGFHATLKAPFRLAPDESEDRLLSAFEDFCAASEPFVIPKLVVSRLGAFIALMPDTPVPALDRLAENAVRTFEPFRAPLSEAELARRKPASLQPDQRANLVNWGYPYVFDAFRFHMTLTGSLNDDQAERTEAALADYFEPLLTAPVEVGSIGLFVQHRPDADFLVHTFARMTAGQALATV